MIDQIYTYFTIEMIFLWLNLGVLPFWLILVFFPQSQICRVFITSIFPFIILSFSYGYLTYVLFNEGYDFIGNFELYLGLDAVSNLFTYKAFIILFWTHFLAMNLFWSWCFLYFQIGLPDPGRPRSSHIAETLSTTS